jgi:hypothetical protein
MTDLPQEERDILADEQAAKDIDQDNSVAVPEDDEPETTDYIEFVGTDPQFGTEFYRPGVVGHSITRKHMRETHDVTMTKDLEWTKAEAGKHKGRMLVPVEGLSQDTLDILENDPMFKRVSL